MFHHGAVADVGQGRQDQRRDADQGGGWAVFSKIALAGGVDRGAVVYVGQVDVDLDDMLGGGSGGFQAGVDVGQGGFRLLGYALRDGAVGADADGAGDPNIILVNPTGRARCKGRQQILSLVAHEPEGNLHMWP